jgi:hypothetical protein
MKITSLTLLLILSITFSFGQNIPTNQNPKYTTSINPKYTTSINPKYTTSINPKYTTSINPKYTSGLNPFNGQWEGKYLFDESANLIGLLAFANSEIYLYYNTQGKWIGYFVRAKSNYNLFSLDGEWTGKYLCSDSKSGYNLFDENGEWTDNYVK